MVAQPGDLRISDVLALILMIDNSDNEIQTQACIAYGCRRRTSVTHAYSSGEKRNYHFIEPASSIGSRARK